MADDRTTKHTENGPGTEPAVVVHRNAEGAPMIFERFTSAADDDHYIERTADRLRSMTSGSSKVAETDPAEIRARFGRRNRAAESRFLIGEPAA